MKKFFTILIGLLVSLSTTQAQSWDEITNILPKDYLDNDNNKYGYSVAIDGDYAVIGAPRYNNKRGLVFVLQNNAGTWERIAILSMSLQGTNDEFGVSVSILGDVIVVGRNGNVRGSAHVFVKPDAGWEDMHPTATLNSSDNDRGYYFGRAVSISGDDIIVGSSRADNIGADNIGAAYIFTKPVSGWSGNILETAKLTPSAGETNGYFGSSVSINNNNVVIGSHRINSNTGAAYVYTKPSSGWVNANENAILTASDATTSDKFGYSVSILGDDIIIGAHQHSGSEDYCGAAYAFTKPSSGWATTTETTKITTTIEKPYNFFGCAISMYGNYVAIGASGHRSSAGSTYIYEKQAGIWNLSTEKILTSSDNNENGVDYSVAISGTEVIIGYPSDDVNGLYSGSIYCYTQPISGWENTTENSKISSSYITNNNFGDSFGKSVSIYGDYAVVGSPNFNLNEGIAYVLHNDNGVWTNIARLQISNSSVNAYLGSSVSIFEDVIVVGAEKQSYKGAVFVYVKPSSGWADMTETAKLTPSTSVNYDYFGCSVSIYNNVIAVGSKSHDLGESNKNYGAVFVYSKPSSGWVDMTETAKLTSSDKMPNDEFGTSVKIYDDVIIAGAPKDDVDDDSPNENSGSAYIFAKPSSGWSTSNETAKLTSSDVSNIAYFGTSVSIFADDIVIGAYQNDNIGSAYVYTKPIDGWATTNTETAKLTSSTSTNYSHFGFAVDISNSNIVVGAKFDDDKGSSSGTAYVFSKPSSGWISANETSKLTASDGASNDNLGNSIAIYGDNIIIGAHNNNDKGSDSGSAYIFNYSSSLSIDKNTFSNDFSLYPNPTTGLVTINHKNAKHITISDINGRIIISKEIENNKVEVNLSDYNKGIYFVTISNDKSTTTKKILKQ